MIGFFSAFCACYQGHDETINCCEEFRSGQLEAESRARIFYLIVIFASDAFGKFVRIELMGTI
jgi:hypothetical protein